MRASPTIDPRSLGNLMSRAALGGALLVLLAVLLLGATPALAQECSDNPDRPWDPDLRWESGGGSSEGGENCSGGYHCWMPRSPSGPYISKSDPQCDANAGPCQVDLHVPIEIPGNSQNPPGSEGAAAYLFEPGSSMAGCTPPSHCDSEAFCAEHGGGASIHTDFGEMVVPGGPVQCPDTEHERHRPYDALFISCYYCCHPALAMPGLDFTPPAVAAALGCLPPKKDGCNDPRSCRTCGEGGTPLGGGGPAWGGSGPLSSGPGASLRYTAGGVGHIGHPGSRELNVELGRYWMMSYSTRVVAAPGPSHVWLLTETATYREFWDEDADGSYERASPSDEYRKLTYSSTTGWRLAELDGMVHAFGLDGRWLSTTDRNGNAKAATYTAGQLTRVSFPDGRHEDFTYHEDSGRLASITEVGVDGVSSRTWLYRWSWLDLERITLPDGLYLDFFYGDLRHPGYLTRIESVHSTELPDRRVLRAWEYDERRNVVRTWKGDASPTGPNAVEVWSFSYDDPVLPTETTVTDPLGNESVYTLEREAGSGKARLAALSGSCPVCATGPNSQLLYDDPDHPLLATRELDALGHETAFEHDTHGQKVRQIEAVGESESRVTEWSYSAEFPALVEEVIGPYPAGGLPSRRLELDYEPGTGNLLVRREIGVEEQISGALSTFTLETTYTYNSAGQALTIDPPGSGTADVVSFTYDASRGGLVPLTRTDPLVGTTSFVHDAFNRQTSVADVNGVLTQTRYDALSRVTHQIARSVAEESPGDPIDPEDEVLPADIVTEWRYTLLGDLWRILRPGGGWAKYLYDAAGRLEAEEVTDRTAFNLERRKWTLDGAGNRIREELQSYASFTWTTRKTTDFVYTSRCQLSKILHADGSVTEHDYDCAGNLARTWDENHPSANQTAPASQVYGYDALHRMTSVSQPWAGGGSAVTSYSYDAQDHLVAVTDAEGNSTSYSYSDRDLLTKEVSPVSGTTRHGYSEHGELVATLDARGITTARTLDAAGRVTLVDLPGTSLDTAYTYEDGSVPWSQGRLTRIERGETAIDYRYDRFGRTTQDGALSYVLDENGDPLEIVYPGGVRAVYTYLVPGRPKSLTLRRDGLPDELLVDEATYLPFGPVERLDLVGTLKETHTYTSRYFPESIRVTSSSSDKLRWDYTTDAVGNVTSIEQLAPAPTVTRTYAYQDFAYFLSQGDGPWGTLSWSYDKIGNRLSETRSGVTDAYTYLPNATSGHTALLEQVTLGAGGTRAYEHGPAGHLEQVEAPGNTVTFSNDATGQLSRVARPAVGPFTDFLYDGRGFLTRAAGELPGETSAFAPSLLARDEPLAPPEALIFADDFETGNTCRWSLTVGSSQPLTCPTPIPVVTHALYSSDGALHHLRHDETGEESFLFYFAGRPLAQLVRDGDPESDTYHWLATDHLGTPIAKIVRGTTTTLPWVGGFEPFGADWQAGTPQGASENGVLLRFPGQWVDEAWQESSLGAEVYYNVYRWYARQTGRYTSVDPAGITEDSVHPLLYVSSGPTRFTDPLGLRRWPFGGGKFCRDRSCDCEPPIRVLGEDGPTFVPTPPAGQCVEADAVYSASGVVKIPDNFRCTLRCRENSARGDLICRARPYIPGQRPQPFPPTSPLPPGWPPNPFSSGGS